MSDRKPARRHDPKPARPAAAKGGRSFTLTPGGAALVLGLLTLLFFHALVFEGKTFVSPDTTAPAGFVRVGEQSLYKDHVYPLWNPYVFLGMPSFASGAYNPLIYPPDWPLALVNKVVPLPDMTWMLLYYFLGGLFLFLLARELGARPEGALLAATVFVFAPNLVAVGSHGHGSQLVDSAYLPLMLWLAARWLRRGGLHHLAWLALAGGFQLLRGHVQICFYTWAAVGLYLVVEWVAALWTRRPGLRQLTLRVLGVAAAAGVAFGLAGFYNLPLQDYARHSIRGGGSGGGVGMGYATSWSMAPYELPSVVVPGWAGFGGSTYWGGMPFTDYPNAFVGIVALLLAIPAFLAGGAKRVFALVLGVLALLISFGRYLPLYGFLYDHLPLFNKFRVPVMVIILFQLAVALGTAWGWSAILPGGEPRADEARARGRRVGNLLLALGGVLALVLVVALVGQGAWRDAYIGTAMAQKGAGAVTLGAAAGPEGYSAQDAAAAWQVFFSGLRPASGISGDLGIPGVGWVPGLVLACVLGLLALGVAWSARRGWLPPLAATAGVLVIMLLELWPVSAHVMGPVVGEVPRRDLNAGRDDVVQFLERAGPAGSFRIFTYSPDEPVPNRYAGFAIGNVSGYHAAKPRLFQDLAEGHLQRQVDVEWLRLLNVRYIVECEARAQQIPPPPDLRLVFRSSQADPNLGPLLVYEYPAALPRAMLLEHYAVVGDARAIIDSVSLRQRDVAAGTWLQEDPGLQLGPIAGGRAHIVSYQLNRVAIDVDTPGPALLRLADLWYPDWTARVDGRRTPILKADYLLRAVAVPAGRHRVEFRFESPAVRRGLLLSLASLLVVLAGFAGASWMARRPRTAATHEEAA